MYSSAAFSGALALVEVSPLPDCMQPQQRRLHKKAQVDNDRSFDCRFFSGVNPTESSAEWIYLQLATHHLG